MSLSYYFEFIYHLQVIQIKIFYPLFKYLFELNHELFLLSLLALL